MSDTLRSKLIRLAHTNQELRPLLLPILRQANSVFTNAIEKKDGLFWSRPYEEVDGVEVEDEDKFEQWKKNVSATKKVLATLLDDPIAGLVAKEAMRGYDRLSWGYRTPSDEKSYGVVIYCRSLPVLGSDWEVKSSGNGRTSYIHPDTDWKVTTSHRERMVYFTK